MKPPKSLPYLKDAFPSRAQYQSGEEVIIEIELHNPSAMPAEIELFIQVYALNAAAARFHETLLLKPRKGCKASVAVDSCAGSPGGFGVDVEATVAGKSVGFVSTAYDIVGKWSAAPRYGFLSGFYRQDEGDRADVEQLRKYHISAVQFYDWMYRHHDLIPPQDYFKDPMGRELSLAAVRGKIALCHEFGMKAIAYGAVYAASREFASRHPDMRLFQNDGGEETFGDGWQNIMDVSAGSGWDAHIVGQYERAVRELDFDGIHMDTYGYPKTAFAGAGAGTRFVRLAEEHPKLIDRAKEALCRAKPYAGVIFNSVGNWPAAEAARSHEDAAYVEVWPPYDRYIHLHDIIADAAMAGQKPVILAAYISPFKDGPTAAAERALLLTQAVIFASGGYHMVLGENNGVLCDPYYVNHATLRKSFVRTLRNWYDYIVRYSELLYNLDLKDVSMTHAGGINEEYVFSGGAFSSCGEPNKIWTLVKEMPGAKVIHLINLTGLRSDKWNEGKPKPRPAQDIAVQVLDNERASGVWLASPDRNFGKMEQLPFAAVSSQRGRVIMFSVPELEYWDMVYIKTEY